MPPLLAAVRRPALCLALVAAGAVVCLQAEQNPAPINVEITAKPGNQQTFAGFGASLVRDDRSTPELGYDLPDPKGNSGRAILYEAQPFRCTPLLKYDYLKALALVFDRGAVLCHCLAAPGGEMTYTFGRKPPVNAAVARHPDGTWAASGLQAADSRVR